MSTADSIAVSADGQSRKSPRIARPLLLAHCIALPLFGRALFPLVRDKTNITFASSFTDPQMAATYLVALVVVFGLLAAGNPFEPVERSRVARAFLLFVSATLVSSLGSHFLLFSIWRTFEVLLLGLWALLMLKDAAGVADPPQAIRAFYTVSLAILIGVFVGLVINPSGAWYMEGDVARLTGTTGYWINPNDIGVIAAVLTLGCYVRAVERGSFRYSVAAVLFLIVCYLPHSRGSYIALATGFVAATIMLGRIAERRATVAVMGLCVPVAILVIALASHDVRDFFAFLMTRGHETENLDSFGGRLPLWEFGLKAFKQHPFFGTGYGVHPEGLQDSHFHNLLIELAVTTGMMGALSYIAFLVSMLGTVRKAIGRSIPGLVAERIIVTDLVTIPTVILVAGGASASATYYCWDLLGLVSVAVTASLFVTGRRNVGPACAMEIPVVARFSNLMT